MKVYCILALAVLVANLARADGKPTLLADIKYYFNGRELTNEPVLLHWDSPEVCSARAPAKQNTIHYSAGECLEVSNFVQDHWADLKKSDSFKNTAKRRKSNESHHAHFADLEVNHLIFGILIASPKLCDAHHENCMPSSEEAADQLGFKIIQMVNKIK